MRLTYHTIGGPVEIADQASDIGLTLDQLDILVAFCVKERIPIPILVALDPTSFKTLHDGLLLHAWPAGNA
jgi:hypothetical protein